MGFGLKSLYIFFTMLLLNLSAFCQRNDYVDVVYLKNGEIIDGIVMEMIPNESILIRNTEGSEFSYKMEKIEKIEKKLVKGQDIKQNTSQGKFNKYRYRNTTELGMSIGFGSIIFNEKNNSSPFTIHTINSLQYNENFSLGLGIGFERYNNFSFFYTSSNLTLLPLFIDARVNFIKEDLMFVYFFTEFGYSIGFANKKVDTTSQFMLADFDGGLMINPGIGFRVFVTGNYEFTFNIGYRIQQISTTIQGPPDSAGNVTEQSRNYSLRFIPIRIGMSF